MFGKLIAYVAELFAGHAESTGERALKHKRIAGKDIDKDQEPSLQEVESVRREVRSA